MDKGKFANPTGSRGYGQNAFRAAAGDQGANPQVSQVAVTDPEVNKFDQEGNTKLHNRSYDGNTKQMYRLLNKSADINLSTNNEYGDTPLHKAVAGGHLEAVQLLLESGVQVDKANKTVQTPGHYASHHCNPGIITALLKANANPMAREDECGDDWLHKVTSSKCANNATKREIFVLLKSFGVTIVQNDNHKTAYDYTNDPELLGMLKAIFE